MVAPVRIPVRVPAPRRMTLLAWLPLLILAGLALFGPALAPHDPLAQDLLKVMAPPERAHLLGTDHVGRDLFSRLLAAAPNSLGLALLCVGLSATLGGTLGLSAASSGWLGRTLILRLADMTMACPGLLLALLFAGLLGGVLGGSLGPMLIGLTLAQWPTFARLAEAVAAGVLREGHVEAARLAGFSTPRILLRHVLPRVSRTLVPLVTLGLGQAILSISALGFLGLGLRPPIPEWGAMIHELLPFMTEGPVQMAAPCLMIFCSVLVFTLTGRRLAGHRALDHRLETPRAAERVPA